MLQDYFECTNWDVFKTAATRDSAVDLEDCATGVTSYISHCVVLTKRCRTDPNQKPWINSRALTSNFIIQI